MMVAVPVDSEKLETQQRGSDKAQIRGAQDLEFIGCWVPLT
jgi:hypothetical protein